MENSRQEALESMRYYVWSGYYDPEETFEIIDEDIFESDGEDEDWLRAAIQREFAKKRKAERAWPKVTACDRLDRAFEALEARGILTAHKVGYTQQDGLDVVRGMYKEAGGKKSGFVGACFYTIQDLEGALWGDSGLWLAFGAFPGKTKSVAVGRMLCEEFERARFTVDWDGTAESRLLLSGFRWQRRGPAE